jgi:hypothetical protein
MDIDAIESSGWLGIAPVILAAWIVRRHLHSTPGTPTSHAVRQWALVGLLFFVWALGPHLTAFGVNTGMILPQALLRYLPFVGNARIPGRAIVVTYLALAVLSAIAVAEWRKSRGRNVALLAIAAAVIADYLPAPFPLVALERPSIYEVLRDRAEAGAVCELPLGIRDGFGERGAFDDRVLFHQTIHGRPLVGGFVARLPPRVVRAYEDDPLLAGLLQLSGPHDAATTTRSLPNRQLAADRLIQSGVAFVVLDRDSAPDKLVEYVERVLPLIPIAHQNHRSLYLVTR